MILEGVRIPLLLDHLSCHSTYTQDWSVSQVTFEHIMRMVSAGMGLSEQNYACKHYFTICDRACENQPCERKLHLVRYS